MTGPESTQRGDGTERWSAPVRYVEADQQGVVFNAHYLTYCDEAFAAYCRARGLEGFAEAAMLKTSTLTWAGPLRFGETVDVDARCVRVGRTSVELHFTVTTASREVCEVRTTYVHTDTDGRPAPLTDDLRASLTP